MAFTKIRALMTKLSDNFPFLGTVTGTTIADNSITNAKFASTIAASNFSGALPAIDGSALTGLSATTNSASDPAIDTNGTLGDVFINTTSGETYICTDATTDNNVWTNVGPGTGDVIPYMYQGTQYGYEHGGEYPASTNRTSITKYSFTSDGGSTFVANLTTTGAYDSGFHSSTHGYRQGAEGVNVIDKYIFATDTLATNVGDMPELTNSANGIPSAINGYVVGGYQAAQPSVATRTITSIHRVSFSSDGNAINVADMATRRIQSTTASDTVNGYIMCGAHAAEHKTQVDKFPYASEADATDIGDMTTGGYRTGGSSSTTHGYGTGGAFTTPVDVIDKFNFSGAFVATDIGNLIGGNRMGLAASSSTTHGYTAGGNYTGAAGLNVIEKISFSVDGNSSDVGDLDQPKDYNAGASY